MQPLCALTTRELRLLFLEAEAWLDYTANVDHDLVATYRLSTKLR